MIIHISAFEKNNNEKCLLLVINALKELHINYNNLYADRRVIK